MMTLTRWVATFPGSKNHLEYLEVLDERPELSKLAASLRHEMVMNMPVTASHEVLRMGKFSYTVDAATSDVYRSSSVSSTDASRRDVREPAPEAEPELVFRVEDVRPGARVTGLRLSRSGKELAVVLGSDGGSHVYVVDGEDVVYQEHVRGAMGVEFGCAPGTLVYTVADATGRPSKVVETAVARAGSGAGSGAVRWTPQSPEATVVFEDDDPAHFIGVQRTKDWGGLVINSVAKTSSEAFLLGGDGAARSVRRRRDGVTYAVERFAGRLVMMSDERGEHAIYVRREDADEDEADGDSDDAWQMLYAPAGGETVIEDMTVNRNAITVLERNTTTGLPVVRVLPLSLAGGGKSTKIGNSPDVPVVDVERSFLVPVPDFALDCRFGANEEFASDLVELEFLSPVVPTIRIGFDVVTKTSYMATDADMEDDGVMIENNLNNYTAVRVPFTSSAAGGHTIPLTLAYRNDASNPSPALWIAYGAYGECLDMEYSPFLMSLMNRGFKIIWCHVRGGGELGRAFYHAGRRRNLEHSADDLRECLAFMKEKGVTSRNAVFSHSAGAIAACGALDLADAVVLESPFVDLVGAMREDAHALTRHEYDEFGDPSDEHDRAVMRRACPQARLATTGARPAMLLCSGTDDEHVSAESVRRYAQTYGGAAALWENAYDGHLPDTADELLATRAGQLAFIIDAVGRCDVGDVYNS